MKTGRILLLCILAAALVSTVICTGLGPEDCCFAYYPRRIKKTLIKNYYPTDQRCSKTGIIFVTNQSRRICTDPNMSWVESIMKYLDEKDF